MAIQAPSFLSASSPGRISLANAMGGQPGQPSGALNFAGNLGYQPIQNAPLGRSVPPGMTTLPNAVPQNFGSLASLAPSPVPAAPIAPPPAPTPQAGGMDPRMLGSLVPQNALQTAAGGSPAAAGLVQGNDGKWYNPNPNWTPGYDAWKAGQGAGGG